MGPSDDPFIEDNSITVSAIPNHPGHCSVHLGFLQVSLYCDRTDFAHTHFFIYPYHNQMINTFIDVVVFYYHYFFFRFKNKYIMHNVFLFR